MESVLQLWFLFIAQHSSTTASTLKYRRFRCLNGMACNSVKLKYAICLRQRSLINVLTPLSSPFVLNKLVIHGLDQVRIQLGCHHIAKWKDGHHQHSRNTRLRINPLSPTVTVSLKSHNKRTE